MTPAISEPGGVVPAALGANGYVVKPVAFEAFMEAERGISLCWLLVNHHAANLRS